MGAELEQIKKLYDLMLERNLDALELKEEEFRVKLVRRHAGASHTVHAPTLVHAPSAPAAQTGAAEAAAQVVQDTSASAITAPLPGVFYRASSPNSPPYVKEGDVVETGQTLCIVEAMKVMNEIKAEAVCKIVKIVAENGRPVAAGQVLFQIEPA